MIKRKEREWKLKKERGRMKDRKEREREWKIKKERERMNDKKG